jgi:hypothetical protein
MVVARAAATRAVRSISLRWYSHSSLAWSSVSTFLPKYAPLQFSRRTMKLVPSAMEGFRGDRGISDRE